MKLYIKELRKQRGISLRELSRKSGISIGYLSELENELNKKNNPTVKNICKIAKALEINPAELFKCN